MKSPVKIQYRGNYRGELINFDQIVLVEEIPLWVPAIGETINLNIAPYDANMPREKVYRISEYLAFGRKVVDIMRDPIRRSITVLLETII